MVADESDFYPPAAELVVRAEFFNQAGCKESQFYGLPFGQVVASMY